MSVAHILPIPDYDHYFCSDDGVIYSNLGKGGTMRALSKNIKNGYNSCMLTRHNKTMYVHRLVAITFIGDIPEGMVVDHIDGDKRNNKVDNLRIVTKKFNVSGKRRNSFRKSSHTPKLQPTDGNFRTIDVCPNYEVDQFGNVRNKLTGKFKKCHVPDTGYIKVGAVVDGKRRIFQLHRIVAQTWVENPDNKTIVNHIDHNRENPCASNLEWVTPSENMKAYWEHKRSQQPSQ